MKYFVFIIIFALIVGGGYYYLQFDRSEVVYDKSIELWESKNYQDAIQNFIVVNKTSHSQELVTSSIFWVATIYHHYLKDDIQAIVFYKTIQHKFSKSQHYKNALLNLIELYSKDLNKNSEKIIYLYKKLFSQQDEHKEMFLYPLARVYIYDRNYEKARSVLKHLIVEYPKSDLVEKSYLLIGFSYYLEGKMELALATYKGIIHNNVIEKGNIKIQLASLYEELDNLEEAIGVYTDIIHNSKDISTEKEILQQHLSSLKEKFARSEK